jgi:predicted dehydrogenase
MTKLRGIGIGAGYFSQFHYEAWSRIAGVEITAVCDRDTSRATAARERFGLPRQYSDFQEALAQEHPDFVDIITPAESHAAICRAAAQAGAAIICQKPLAPTLGEARALVEQCAAVGARFMVHENFRFQPWHREIKRLLEAGAIGSKLHSLTFRSRPGDGWGTDAYLGRQPYFRTMPRLLIHETGVHFVDTFRYLAGEVVRVYALLRTLNPVIAGEDCGLLIFEFATGAIGVWDANRYNESTSADPRYTFGEFLVEADGGSIRLAPDGTLTVQKLGEPERRHDYHHERRGFSGDCVFATQQHFVSRLRDGAPFETEGAAYLRTLAVVEALYESARRRLPVALSPGDHHDATVAL